MNEEPNKKNTLTFSDLKKNLKKNYSGFEKYKIAILGDSSTQLIHQSLRGYGFIENIDFEILEADYDQIERQVFDPNSELYKFNPEFVIIFQSSEKLIEKFYFLEQEEKCNFATNLENQIKLLWEEINKNISCNIIHFNFVEINDYVFGNYANKINFSFIYQIRKLNFELMNLTMDFKNVFINDVLSLQNETGYKAFFDPRMYFSSKMTFSIEVLPLIAKNITGIILSLKGKTKKCLVMDLDNTLWGGVIGDDGLNRIEIGELGIGKAFSLLQMWVKQLKNRGIILAICSKNTESIAKEPFEKHPDMILHLGDIAIFVANWENKADNIKHIQSVLNINFDSMVFIDDNPFERNLIRELIPSVNVPELPDDPAEFFNFLRNLNLFETISFSKEDSERTMKYQVEAERARLEITYSSVDEYLQNLKMHSEYRQFDDFHLPRISQLTQRSNQFNLRTIRYSEQNIKEIMISEKYLTLYFSLEDKFGDYGLIGLFIGEKIKNTIFIDTLIMSCRVLKRGMEEFILNKIVKLAIHNGVEKIIGEYIPTAKNGIVKDLYKNLGFSPFDNNKWELNLKDFIPQNTFIKEK